jgi:Flp pilus assembly protein TadD
VETNPQYAEARNNLGIIMARRGRIEEAIAQFQNALDANPASAEIRNNLGAALASRKRNPDADRSESR